MGTPARPPPISRRGERQRPEPKRMPRGMSRGMWLAAGLLGISLALLLIAWTSLGGAGRMPSSAGYMSPTAGRAAATGAVVEATEVTATPSRGEPTEVVPSSPAASGARAFGTALPGAPVTSTANPPTASPAAIEITCSQAENNVSGEVCIHTTPGAALTISVTYCNGLKARNADLQGTRYADSDGNYTWTWVPETTCPGTATAHVSASGTGGSSDATGAFTVSP